jgi:phosphoglycerate dehydrogenase-like enzyme
MAAMLAFAKRMPQTFLSEPPERMFFPDTPLAVLAGATLALVGLGGIGTAIARRALAFDMRVRAVRRTAAPSPIAGVQVVRSLDDLLADADHLALAVPSTPRTRQLLDAAAFAKVKPGLHVVNVARGELLDEDALRAALDDGRVAMATLDAVDPEPLPAGHWMYTHPRVRLTPHISWSNPDMTRLPVEMFVENLGRFRRGEPLHDVVDRAEGY